MMFFVKTFVAIPPTIDEGGPSHATVQAVFGDRLTWKMRGTFLCVLALIFVNIVGGWATILQLGPRDPGMHLDMAAHIIPWVEFVFVSIGLCLFLVHSCVLSKTDTSQLVYEELFYVNMYLQIAALYSSLIGIGLTKP